MAFKLKIFLLCPFILLMLASNSRGQLSLAGKVFLEGPYNELTNQMNYDLKADTLYESGFFVPRVPLAAYNAVDVVKVYLRKSDAITVVDSARAWISSDGKLYKFETYTSEILIFYKAPSGNYFVEVRHRNHLPIMSSTAISLTSVSVTSVDLTNINNVYGKSAIALSSDKCAMIGGNAFEDGMNEINASDLYKVSKDSDNLKTGYLNTDVDLNGVVNGIDRQFTLHHNMKLYYSKIPKGK